jgi:hypothetical protein
MNLPAPRHHKSTAWELLDDFYRWQLRRGESARQGAHFCKILAFFIDIYLPRRFGPTDLATILLGLTGDQVDEYLGVWYPMEAEFASPGDLQEQVAAFRRFARFLEDEGRYSGDDAALADLARRVRRVTRFRRRLESWRSIRAVPRPPDEFEGQCAAWLREDW